MRYGIRANVESNLKFTNNRTIQEGEYKFEFTTDSKNILTSISVSTELTEFSSYVPEMKGKKVLLETKLNTPKELHEKIIGLLRHIESIGSFWFDIKNIDTEDYEIFWVPENEEEGKILSFYSINVTREYTKGFTIFNETIFSQIVREQDKYKNLVIPMAFYREGKNEFKRRKYISAFYNFYFFLEDLFGNRKWRSNDVIDEFMKNSVLQAAITRTISVYNKEYKTNIEDVKIFLSEKQLEFSNEGITKLIVKVRGNLHHYSQQSTTIKGDPFSQKEFEPMAFLLMSICINSYLKLTTK